ncbi:uncharacterized protein LOC121053207 isoform X3 [Oryza brachyantha]|uniref:uncharacterized protein LOC121054438 isoform X3 n=1 Tax=Oryza brachyantha TaxID=4533 RepID=UPI001ADCE51C|nr:uncharacterized protein LOC121054438 isoform X3 [Oryza brachyantha]XP_040379953.1 uncharacterized protein LOC121053207 isoform X3 [Oryza brachyantha]
MWELAEVPGSNDLGWTFLVAVKREPLSGFHSAALPDKLHITYEYLQWQSFAIKNQTTVMFFIMGILLHQMNGKLEGNDVIEATIRVQVDLVFYVICNLLLTR